MSDTGSGGASFEFSTNIAEVASQIDRYLAQIESSLSRQGSAASRSSGTLDFASQITSQFSEITNRYTQVAAKIGEDTRNAIAQGVDPSQITKLGTSMQSVAKDFRAELLQAIEQATREASRIFTDNGAALNIRSVLEQAAGVARGAFGTQAQFQREQTQALPGGGAYVGNQGAASALSRTTDVDKQLEELTAATAKARQQLLDFAAGIAGKQQISASQYDLLSRGASSSPGDAAFLSGSVSRTSANDLVFDNPNGGQQVISPSSRVLAETTQRYQAAVSEAAGYAAEEAAAVADRASATKASGTQISAAEARRAAAEEKAAAAAEQDAQNRARQARVLGDPNSVRVNSQYSFNSGEGGFVDNYSGALVTNVGRMRNLTETLSANFAKANAELEEADKNPIGEFFHGFFGAGGRKRRGGAQEIDDVNPLNGLAETAGVVAKYEVLGVGIYSIPQKIREVVQSYAQLDQAVSQFNNQLGDGQHANESYVQSLQNIGQAAGVSGAEVVDQARRGAAAFSNPGDSQSTKEQAGATFAQNAIQNTVITGNNAKEAGDDVLAAAKAYGLAASQIGEVNNAIANAKNFFGADAKEVSAGLAEVADVGREAGYSLSELAQVIGLIQSRTGEGGQAIATNIGRAFATLESQQGQTFLRQQLNIDPSGTAKEQIEKIAAVFPSLSLRQREATEQILGGSRALHDLLPLLEEQPSLHNAFAAALKNTNAAAGLQNSIMGSLAGQIRQFGQLMKNIGLDLAKTGLIAPFLALFEVMLPVLKLADGLIEAYDRLPKVLRTILPAGAELLVMFNAIRAAAQFGYLGGAGSTLSRARGLGGALLTNPLRPLDLGGSSGGRISPINSASVRAAAAIEEAGALLAGKLNGVAGLVGPAEEAAAAEQQMAAEAVDTATVLRQAAAEAAVAAGGFTSVAEALAATDASSTVILTAAAEEASAARVAAEEAATAKIGVAMQETFDLYEATNPRILTALNGLIDAIQIGAARLAAAASGASVEEVGAGGLAGAIASRGGLRGAAGAFAGNRLVGGLAGFGLGELFGGSTGGLVASIAGTFGGLPAAGAAASLFAAYGSYKDASKVRSALEGSGTAVGELSAGSSADALRKSADDLQNASDKIAHASSGFLGSIVGGLTELGGGANRGAEKEYDRRLSAEANRQAGHLDDIQQSLVSSASAGAFDFSAPSGVANALQAMSRNGASAQEQIDALSSALGNLALAAQGAGKYLATGQSQLFAAKAADDIQQTIAINTEALGDHSHGLRGLNQQKLTSGIEDALNSQFHNLGADKGGKLSVEEVHSLESTAEEALKEQLAQQGIDFAKLPQDIKDRLLIAAKGGVAETYNRLQAANGQVTKDNIDDVLQAAPQLAQTAGQNAATSASLSGQGYAAQLGAQATLANLQKIRSDILAVKPDTDVSNLDTQIQDAQLKLQQATVATLSAEAQLAESLINPLNKGEVISQKISDLQQQIGQTTDQTQLAALNAQLNQLQFSKAQQAIADANSATSAGADPKSKVSEAQAALTAAQNTYNAYQAAGVTGQSLTDAQKAAADASYAFTQAQLADANNLLESYDQYGNKAQELFTKAQELRAQAAQTNDPGLKALQERQAANSEIDARLSMDATTAAYWKAQTDPRNTVQNARNQLGADQTVLQDTPQSDGQAFEALIRKISEDRIALNKALADLANAKLEAGVFPGSALEAASAKLKEAKNTIALDEKGTQQYYTDLAALHQAQIDLANAQIDASDVARQLTIDITNPVLVAQDAVAKAQDKLKSDLKNKAPKDVIRSDTLAVDQAQNAAQKAAFEQQLQDAQTNYELGRTSFSAYLSYLESQHNALVAVKSRTRQQTDELNEVDSAIHSLLSNMAGSQFNLGDIKTPTVYQARRLAALNGIDIAQVEDPAGTGTVYGGPANPATRAAQSVLNPVTQAINSMSPAAQSAVTNLQALQQQLQGLGGASATASTTVQPVTNYVTINGVDFSKVVHYIQSILGSKANRSATTLRKVAG